ncbi:MAG: excinuclease ABC subunit UvrA [Bacteroidales bacterium]|nr:excinuclease ABC subunit UvrA [Bacteroidales bacterium]
MQEFNAEQYDPRQYIIVKGARVHNLKNLSVAIPRNHLVVITGLSGSGKSSLAFDTLYAEGQRRYVESLSSYARQFLGRMSKPEVDYIRGIAPAVAIEQKVNTRNPRSTVGTSTEIYEYLKLLFARIGRTFSPVSGEEVKRDSVTDVTDFILALPQETTALILTPLIIKPGRSLKEQLLVLQQIGFSRVEYENDIMRISDLLEKEGELRTRSKSYLVVDRVRIDSTDPDLSARIADSVQTAFYEGEGSCIIEYADQGKTIRKHFSNRFERDGIVFEEPSVNLFTFNNPFGACKKCEGFGTIIGIDEDLVIPNKSLSVYEEAIACWKGEKMGLWREKLVMNAYKFDFPIHKPVFELTEAQRELLWTGNEHFEGLNEFFRHVEEQTYKIQYRVMLSRYRGRTFCPECKGTRLRKDAGWVKVGGRSISEIVLMQVSDVLDFFRNLSLNAHDQKIADRILLEIRNRLQFLEEVGLGYLTLNRLSNSLSGGESQRINLATSLGSSLVGSMYILDEPSIGLHPRDTYRLIHVLKQLRNLGNTVIVVEHDEEIIREADQVIDIGPMAGSHGGQLVFQGRLEEMKDHPDSLTAAYLSGQKGIAVPVRRRTSKDFIELVGARENNLRNINVRFPLHTMTVVTGVSGSGKSSLVRDVLRPALLRNFGGMGERTGKHDLLRGDLNLIQSVEMVDQNPIGRSSRSNPATYVKAYDDIRALFTALPLAKMRGYKPGFFSFNIEGGRCEECEGEGRVKIEMQFMADIYLTCESCGGRRFKDEVLDVKYQDKNITEILDMTVEEAIEFFGRKDKNNTSEKRILSKLQPLSDVGLGYLHLGQPSSTLSGGEAQRIKLAYFLTRGNTERPTLFIFDEPTTGLHFHDISKLLDAFNALVEHGHSLVVIEHNLEVIKCADWIIDLGPEGGQQGGQLLYEGIPEGLPAVKASHTGVFLAPKLNSNGNRQAPGS